MALRTWHIARPIGPPYIAAKVSQVIEPPAKWQKSALDCLLGDEYEEGGSSVRISD